MKILDIPQSGKCGTFVSVQTRYGQARRSKGRPSTSHSPEQLRIRLSFGHVVVRWRIITEEQRAAWMNFARDVKSRTRLGQSGRLTGYLLFIKINSVLAYQGRPLVDLPPAKVRFDANPVGALVATNIGGVPQIKLSVTETPPTPVLVLATAPCSAGVSFAKHFVIIGVLPDAVAGYADIMAMYVARFGIPPVGKKIFVRTRQVLDGWEDLPVQTSAIVG